MPPASRSRSAEADVEPGPALHLAQDDDADRLLSTQPLALLIGMVLDQQIPLERAFAAPAELRRRLGRELSAPELARMDPGELVGAFSARPALHRFPGSMAGRVQELCRVVTEDYGGRAEAIWEGAPDGETLLRRIQALPGFGAQKAKIFVALLGKQLGVRPKGWAEASAPFGDQGALLSVADIRGPETLASVRAAKAARKRAAPAPPRQGG